MTIGGGRPGGISISRSRPPEATWVDVVELGLILWGISEKAFDDDEDEDGRFGKGAIGGGLSKGVLFRV